MHDEFFNDFIEEFGQPTFQNKVDPKYIESYRGTLPDRLLEYWELLGFSGFKDGLFWITDPAEYEGVLNTWIENTELADLDTFHVIARSGFGVFYLWGAKTGYQYRIDALDGWIFKGDSLEEDIKNGKADHRIYVFFASKFTKRIDLKLENRKPLFIDAVKKLGALEPDEMFTFEPAPFLGGNVSLETVKKVNLHIQLSILADFSEREIVDLDTMGGMAFG